MVEPLFFSEEAAKAKAGGSLEITGPEAKHAVSVRRMRIGEAIQITDGRGARVRGTVSHLDTNSLTVSVTESVIETPSEPTIALFQALAKGDRDELAIQAATELGVSEVIPWQAERSISRWDEAKARKGVERWQSICSEAAKQSLRAWHPLVRRPVSTKELAAKVSDFDLVLVLDPEGQAALADSLQGAPKRLALVVGPEGGIDDRELELLTNAGAKTVHLGREVLRTSTAGVAAIAAILALLGKWGRG